VLSFYCFFCPIIYPREKPSLNLLVGVCLFQRSALAYHNDSLDGGLSRLQVGVSATSSSQSTSKSSGALYRPEGYLHTTSSTSTSGNVPSAYDLPANAGIAPYGWQPDRGWLSFNF